MTKPNPDMESTYSYTSAGNTGRPVHPMCSAMASASWVGLFVARPPAGDKLSYREFTCPHCGSHLFGTSNCNGPSSEWIGHCHGSEEGRNCHFTWHRQTQDSEVMKPPPSAGESSPISPEATQDRGLATPATPSAAASAGGSGDGDKPLRLEYGKRYVNRGGRVTAPLVENTIRYCVSHPFHDKSENVCYREDGRWSESGEDDEEDLIAEYVEPQPAESPATAQSSEWRDIEKEKPAVGDRVIVLLPFGMRVQDDTWTGTGWMNNRGEVSHWQPINPPGSYQEIMQRPQPAESPDDWVAQDRVPLRKIDEYRYLWEESGTYSQWGTGIEDSRLRHNTNDGDDRIEIRCRRKDLPTKPEDPTAARKRKASESPCARCGQPIGNPVFTVCDDCWPLTGAAADKENTVSQFPADFAKDVDSLHFVQVNTPADKPRMRRVLLREYRLPADTTCEWSTSKAIIDMTTGRIHEAEVPE